MARPPLRVIKAADAQVNAPPLAASPPVRRSEASESPAVLEMRGIASALRERAAELLAEAAAIAEKEVSAARCYAEEVIAQALAEAQSIHSAARADGHAQGLRVGHEEGLAAGRQAAAGEIAALQADAQARLEAAATQVQAAQVAAAARCDQVLANMQPEVVRLALSVADHILRQEVANRPEAVVPMVAAALERMRGEAQAQVWLAPADLPAAATRRAHLRLALGGGHVELMADPSLSRGDFLVQSQAGTIEGTLDQQLARVAAALHPAGEVQVPGDGE